MTYDVIFEGDDATGWSAYVPDLPGVGVAGDSLDDVRALIPKTIAMHLEGLREDGIPIPPATPLHVESITVAA
jgi:predicted RNase H-like HicB family nuclease